jgi:predicted glycoside hydrolase/deacetylase ChbG (UPF0249 family)
MTKLLIVNADDFGLNSGANRAIIECHQNGIVTSTTLMVNCPGTKEAAELAKENPELGVGLHFNLTQGRPLSNKHTSLTDKDGNFWRRRQFEKKLLAGKIAMDDVSEELGLQWDVIQSLGISPTHIDSHQHIHVFPGIFKVVSALALGKKVPVRIPQEALLLQDVLSIKTFLPQNILKLFRKVVLAYYCNKAGKYARKTALKTNAYFFSIFGFWPPAPVLSLAHYEKILRRIPEGLSELMVHPAYPVNDNGYSTGIQRQSAQETVLLQNSALKKTIKECNIQLTNYSQWSMVNSQ